MAGEDQIASPKNKGHVVFYGLTSHSARDETCKADVTLMTECYPIGKSLDDVADSEPLEALASRGNTKDLTHL